MPEPRGIGFGGAVGEDPAASPRTPATLALAGLLGSHLEDVVVDEEARGHGVGETLSRAALAEARRRGAKAVSLTSRPSRQAANRLYERIGFAARVTNVYRYDL